MARYKLEYALNEIVEEHLDLSVFDHRYHNDATGRLAFDPKVLLKILLYGYYLAIDGCKLPSNASKKWSGTHNELDEKRKKLERVAERIVQRHRERDGQEQKRTAAAEPENARRYRKKIAEIKDFLEKNEKKRGPTGNRRPCRSPRNGIRSALIGTAHRGNAKGLWIIKHPPEGAPPKRRSKCNEAVQRMRRKFDTPFGRELYSRRMGTVEPVFANIQNKGMRRFTLRGQ